MSLLHREFFPLIALFCQVRELFPGNYRIYAFLIRLTPFLSSITSLCSFISLIVLPIDRCTNLCPDPVLNIWFSVHLRNCVLDALIPRCTENHTRGMNSLDSLCLPLLISLRDRLSVCKQPCELAVHSLLASQHLPYARAGCLTVLPHCSWYPHPLVTALLPPPPLLSCLLILTTPAGPSPHPCCPPSLLTLPCCSKLCRPTSTSLYSFYSPPCFPPALPPHTPAAPPQLPRPSCPVPIAPPRLPLFVFLLLAVSCSLVRGLPAPSTLCGVFVDVVLEQFAPRLFMCREKNIAAHSQRAAAAYIYQLLKMSLNGNY